MRLTTQRITAAALFFAAAGFVSAQDNSALIDMLTRKGIISDQEAEDLRADVSKENTAAMVATSKGSFLDKVTLSGRFQAQFVNMSTDIDGTDADPAYVNHFFMRRMYVGVKAQLMNGLSGYLNYDFAGSTFDAATLTVQLNDMTSIEAGFRKAPFGYDEALISSGKLKSIERSGVTRFFVESNNSRRLGAGSYRQGVWVNLGNPKEGWTGTFAVTNPERDESASGVTSAGNRTNNTFAYWAHGAYRGKYDGGGYAVGASVGFLPDQGGTTLGAGNDLTVYNAFVDANYGKFYLVAEYYGSSNENGAGANNDSSSWGYYIQPSYKLSSAWELVFRYGFVDSDGRGIQLGDGIRSAASGGTMDKLTEYFAGVNWYLRGDDFKLQAGYVGGETKDTLAGGNAKATTSGVRTQLQLQF